MTRILPSFYVIRFATVKNLLHLLIVVAVMFSSCKKEGIKPTINSTTNLVPFADAGGDQQFALIPDSVILDGSASTSSSGSISAFEWREISGPGSPADILSPSSARTVVKNVTAGTYQFELKVTGNGGLYARDTIQIRIQNTVATGVTGLQTSGTAGQEYIFQTRWSFWTDAMGDEIYIGLDPSQSFSIATMASSRTEVSIQLDSSSLWISVPEWNWYGDSIPAPSNNGYVWYFPHFPYYDNGAFIIENYPLNYQLVNRPVKIKVRLL